MGLLNYLEAGTLDAAARSLVVALNLSSNLGGVVVLASHSQQATRFEFFRLIISLGESVCDLS